jgi:hypothetical protein
MGEMGTPLPPAWDQIHGLTNTDIANKTRELQGTLQSIKILQEEAEAGKAEIERMLTAAKVTTVLVDDIRVTMVKGRTTRKLDTDKLLKLGVSLGIVAAATVESVGKPYVRLFSKEDPTE